MRTSARSWPAGYATPDMRWRWRATARTALLAVIEGAPEVALIDIELPDQNGIQVMRQLRTAWPEMRCILMTGQCETHEGDSELAAFMDDGVALLCKPFRPDELLACLYDGLTGARPRPPTRPQSHAP